jgi:hypothetical protein
MDELLNTEQNPSNHSGTQTYRYRMGKIDGRHSKTRFFAFRWAENIYTSSHQNLEAHLSHNHSIFSYILHIQESKTNVGESGSEVVKLH